jgi:hypothetical protein
MTTLKKSENTYVIRSLGIILFEQKFWDEQDLKALFKNKTIILGDFKTEIHQTFSKHSGLFDCTQYLPNPE